MAGPKRRLSLDDRVVLARLVERQEERASAQPDGPRLPAVQPLPQDHRRLTSFETLAGFAELKVQLQMSEMVGLENPFFRVHERRASATTVIGDKTYDNFSSYDYLGLNGHPAVTSAAKTALDVFGASASASRLVAGERPVHGQLEAAVAGHYEAEDAILMVSGHATNVMAISTLLGPRDLVLYDALAHNSIVVGATLARCERRSFPHNDVAALDELLTQMRPRHERVLIVVEGLYSMDGDLPDLQALVAMKRRHGAWLMVDDAHALGVAGARGRGSFEWAGVDPRDVDIWMGTLSKTLAGCGGYIAGSRALVAYLKHFGGGFIYSVGLPPAIAAASLAALALLHAEPERVAKLRDNGSLFLRRARASGLDTGASEGLAVTPVIVGDSILAVALSQRLLARGINVQPIIHPAVPERASRLRFFITSAHEPEQIENAVAVTRHELTRLGSSAAILANPAILRG